MSRYKRNYTEYFNNEESLDLLSDDYHNYIENNGVLILNPQLMNGLQVINADIPFGQHTGLPLNGRCTVTLKNKNQLKKIMVMKPGYKSVYPVPAIRSPVGRGRLNPSPTAGSAASKRGHRRKQKKSYAKA